MEVYEYYVLIKEEVERLRRTFSSIDQKNTYVRSQHVSITMECF